MGVPLGFSDVRKRKELLAGIWEGVILKGMRGEEIGQKRAKRGDGL
jgi:hypothetical protein